MNQTTGKWIIFLGLGLVAAGLVIYFFHSKLHWLGRLPGDIRIEKGNLRIYFPITTMILVSVVLSLILYLIRKIF